MREIGTIQRDNTLKRNSSNHKLDDIPHSPHGTNISMMNNIDDLTGNNQYSQYFFKNLIFV